MIELFHFLKKSSGIYPQSFYEWKCIYGESGVNRLLSSGILKYGNKFDYAKDIYDKEELYKIRYFNGKYYGVSSNDDLPNKQFSEDETSIITFEEDRFAEKLSQTFETKISVFKRGTQDSIYLIGRFSEGKVEYLVFLCFDFRDFISDFESLKSKKSGVVSIPIVYAWGNSEIPEYITSLLLTTSANKICPIEQAVKISGTKISCLISPQKLAEVKESKKVYESYSVWPHQIPDKPKWDDITFLIKNDFMNVDIGFRCKPMHMHFSEFTFFVNSNGSKNSLWNFFVRVAKGKATTKDNSDKTYQLSLNKALKKYFKIEKNALYGGRNEHIIHCRFKQLAIEPYETKKNDRVHSQIIGNGYDGPFDNELKKRKPTDEEFFSEM